jgi:hypothetical protein
MRRVVCLKNTGITRRLGWAEEHFASGFISLTAAGRERYYGILS